MLPLRCFSFALVAAVISLPALAEPIRIGISDALRSLNAESEVRSRIPGNESTAQLAHAYLELIPGAQYIHSDIAFRLHVKKRECVERPWPLSGEWCGDIFNFFTTVGIRFDIAEGCQVTGVDVYKHSTETVGLPLDAAIAHEAFSAVEPVLESYAQNAVTEILRSSPDPMLSRLCGQ